MTVLITGGTGFIGGALLRRLVADGTAVTAVVRSASSADAVARAGATPLEGDLTDVGWFTDVLREHDAAVHTASPGDATSPALDDAVVDAAVAAYAGTDKPFVHTGGIWTYGDGDAITEQTPPSPPALTAWRREREQRLLAADVRATVVEPGIVHAPGQGIAQLLVDGPRTDEGALELVGSGDQHWTTVHVDDLADLYALVLASGEGHGHLIGVSGHSPSVRELGLAVADEVVGTTRERVHERLGEAFGDALLLDQQASGEKARSIGWTPSRPTLVEELRSAHR
jgi:nucleoside-diphosphate-sugar epimerase